MKNINWRKEIKDAWDIALLKKPAMHHIGQDKHKTIFGYYIIIIGGILGLIGSQIYPMMFQPTLKMGLHLTIVQILSIIFAIYTSSYIAKTFFKGHGKHDEFFRISAYGMIVLWIGLVPHLSFIGGIWGLVIMFMVLKTVHKLSTGSTIGTLIITVIAIAIISQVLSPLMPKVNVSGVMKYNGSDYINMQNGKMKITTKDGEIEYTIPNIK